MITTATLEEIIKTKFLSPEKFSLDIEKYVLQNNCNYIEGIIAYCEIHKIDIETVPKLLSKTLKEKLKHTATELNFLKKTTKTKSVI